MPATAANRRLRTRLAALTTGLLLAGCAAPPPAAPPQAGPQITGTVPSAAPAPASAPLTVKGLATVQQTPFADATVSAYVAGEARAIATAQTAADGSFALAIPAGYAGKLLKVVATRGTTSLVGATTMAVPAPSRWRLAEASGDVLRLTLGTTLAYLTLSSRYTALAQTSLSAGDVQTALQALRQASESALKASALLTQPETEALLAGVGANGDGSVPPALRPKLAPLGGELATAFVSAANTLNSLLRSQAQIGAKLPAGLELSQIVFAGTLLNGGTGGGGLSTVTGSVTVSTSDAVFTGNSNAVSASAQHTPGAVIGGYQLSGTPVAMASDGGDGMWVATSDGTGYAVTHLTPSRASVSTVRAESATGGADLTMTADGSGGVWLAAAALNRVTHVTDSAAADFTVGALPGPLVSDGAGGVWVGNVNGNSLTHLTSASSDTVALSLSPEHLASDGSGGVWATSSGLAATFLHVVGNQATQIDPRDMNDFSTSSGVKAMISDGNGRVWFTTPALDGVRRLGASSVSLYPYAIITDKLVPGENGSTWFFTFSELRNWDGTNVNILSAPSAIDAAADGAGGLWYTTSTGVARWASSSTVTTSLGGAPTHLGVDAAHDAWVALNDGMVYEVSH